MRGLNLQPISVLVTGSLLLGSVAWWALSAPEIIDPGRPSWKGAEIENLIAAVPEIDKFMAFYVNDDNPFVPYNLRLAEGIARDPNSRFTRNPPTTVARITPPRPSVDVFEQQRPRLVLPKISPAPADAPVVVGYVGGVNEQALLVRMQGAETSIRMIPGDKAEGWTLVAIDNANLATFLDPRGFEHRYAIGEGDLAVIPAGEGEGPAAVVPIKNEKKDNNKGPAPAPEMKNVPRPLPLPERKPREKSKKE